MEKKIVARVEDLMFRAKVDAACRHLSTAVEFLKSADDIANVAAGRPAAVFVELTAPAVDAVRRLRSEVAGRSIPIVGFLSHIDRKLADAAREAGIERVLSRSEFSETLPDLIMEFTAPGVERAGEEEPELPEE